MKAPIKQKEVSLQLCHKCEIEKDSNEFYPNSKLTCKKCVIAKIIERTNTVEGRKKIIAYEEKRAKDPSRQAKVRKYSTKSYNKNKDKVAARSKTRALIKSGVIKVTPCQVCGHKKVEAHHTDYSNPSKVDFLCRIHHKKLEGQTPYYNEVSSYPSIYRNNYKLDKLFKTSKQEGIVA